MRASDYILIIMCILSLVMTKDIKPVVLALLILLLFDPVLKLSLSLFKSYKPNSRKLGMPSGHSWAAVFLGVVIFLKLPRSTATILTLILAMSVPILRVTEDEHTVSQSVVGSLLGVLTGMLFT
jgi:membrane-associated phospholipid phosphatase